MIFLNTRDRRSFKINADGWKFLVGTAALAGVARTLRVILLRLCVQKLTKMMAAAAGGPVHTPVQGVKLSGHTARAPRELRD